MSRTLSGLRREAEISVEKPQRHRASARVEGRISRFFLSCSRVPLELRRGPQGPARGASGNFSLHVSCKELSDSSPVSDWAEVFIWISDQNLRFPLQCLHGSPGSSGVSTRVSGFISCANMQVRFPLELENQCQASCRVDIGISGVLSRFHWVVTAAVMF